MDSLPAELVVKIARYVCHDFVSLVGFTNTCQSTRDVLAAPDNDMLWKPAAKEICFYIDRTYGLDSWRLTCLRLWVVVGQQQNRWCHVEDNSVVKRYWDMRIDKGSIYTMGLATTRGDRSRDTGTQRVSVPRTQNAAEETGGIDNDTDKDSDYDNDYDTDSDQRMTRKSDQSQILLCGGTFRNAAQLNTLASPSHHMFDVVNRKTAPVDVIRLGPDRYGLIVKFNMAGNNMTASVTDFSTWRFDLTVEGEFLVSGLVMLVHCAMVDPDGTGHFVFNYTTAAAGKRTLLICQEGQQHLTESDLRDTTKSYPPKWFVPTRSFINSFSRIGPTTYCLYLQTNIAIYDSESGEIWNCFHSVSNWNATVVFCGPWVVLAIGSNVYVSFLARKQEGSSNGEGDGEHVSPETGRSYRTPLARRVSETISRNRFEEEGECWATLLVKKRININRTFEEEVVLSTENVYQKFIYLHRPFQESDHVFLNMENMSGIRFGVEFGTKEVAIDGDMRVHERR